jgi:ABC-2 type transport system permease protein
MLAQLRVPWAFIVRDFRIESSYMLGFVLRIASVLLNVLIYYFIANVFGETAAPYLKDYGGNYFAFVIIGVAFSDYLELGISAISECIREGQMMGTLELMLLSPTRLLVVLLSSSLWSYVFATMRTATYMLVGMALGMRLGNANIGVALLALLIAILSFNALGLFAASMVILMKRGTPLSWMIRVGSMLLGGVYYPVGVLPGWLQAIGQALPLTHALELMRRSLLLGEGISQLGPELLSLTAITVVLLPLGLLACHLAIGVARTDGSLSHY